MKPIIGILLRYENKKLYVKQELFAAIISLNGIPIGIYLDSKINNALLELCDGFILPGGDDYTKEELHFLKELYDLNKRVLGLCLGMQTMGVLFNGELFDINNHKSMGKYVHKVMIDKNSLLYKILKKDRIMVNSRHLSSVKKTNLKVCATSIDGVVEAIESSNKTFFMGLQWHPESLYLDDEDARNILKYFINVCGDD